MSGITQQIELGRMLRVGAGKNNLLISPAHVQRIELLQFVRVAIHGNCSGSANIENPQLAALGKVRSPECVISQQRQRLAGGYRGTDHRAVKINISQANLSRLKKIAEQKRLAQFFRSHRAVANGVRHLQYFHGITFFPHVAHPALRNSLS